jgi:hypothetical protein
MDDLNPCKQQRLAWATANYPSQANGGLEWGTQKPGYPQGSSGCCESGNLLRPSSSEELVSREKTMRIREGDYAYDIEPVKDPSTMLFKHFKVTMERLNIHGDMKVFEGTAKTFEEAKSLAEKKLKEFEENGVKRAG